MSGSNLPPGVTESMIPGNRPSDLEEEAFYDALRAALAEKDLPEGILETDDGIAVLEIARDLGYEKGRGDAETDLALEQAAQEEEITDPIDDEEPALLGFFPPRADVGERIRKITRVWVVNVNDESSAIEVHPERDGVDFQTYGLWLRRFSRDLEGETVTRVIPWSRVDEVYQENRVLTYRYDEDGEWRIVDEEVGR